MNTFSQVPPGFRFHPTDEELVDYYLRRKVASRAIDLDVIKDVDLYRIEPWDLQELCRIGTEEQNEWYFFSHKDKKYPTGTRTNRATAAGFWKATGRDKTIYSKHDLIGMRKTLVFYKGRAPNGQKSDWIMHEYRLETDENAAPQEEGWVVCRVFKKKIATTRKLNEHDSPIWYEDQVSFMPDMESSRQHNHSNTLPYGYPPMSPNCKKQMESHYGLIQQEHFLQLPNLESPNNLQAREGTMSSSGPGPSRMNPGTSREFSEQINQRHDQNLVTDWRVLDKFVASQLSHQAENDHTEYKPGLDGGGPENTLIINVSDVQEMAPEKAIGPSSGCHISNIWK